MTPPTPFASGSLNWSVFRNTSVQMAGRFFLSLTRLVAASLIVRSFGRDRYGEYAILLGLMVLAEWVVDFGLNDIFVREICQGPERRERLLRALTASKLLQSAAAYGILVLLVAAMRYPGPIVRAALVAGTSLVLHGGILVYRAHFKSTLRLDLDMLAEVLGVLAMIPLLWLASVLHASLAGLAACHVASRAVSLLVAVAVGGRGLRLGIQGVDGSELVWGFRQAAAIGVSGFIVGIYEVVDTLMLSKMATPAELAFYAGAQKLVWPVLLALSSVGLTLFPVLASSFRRDPDGFRSYFQGGVDAVIVLSAAMLSGLAGGAEFLLGLFAPQMVAAAPILRVLSLVCFVKAITTAVGPVLFVTGAQWHALWVTSSATLLKIGLLAVLIPRYGAMGAAVGFLATEVLGSLVPTVLVVQHFVGCRLRWVVLAKVGFALVLAHGATRLLGTAGSLLGGLLAASLFTLLAVAVGALRPRALGTFLPPTWTGAHRAEGSPGQKP